MCSFLLLFFQLSVELAPKGSALSSAVTESLTSSLSSYETPSPAGSRKGRSSTHGANSQRSSGSFPRSSGSFEGNSPSSPLLVSQSPSNSPRKHASTVSGSLGRTAGATVLTGILSLTVNSPQLMITTSVPASFTIQQLLHKLRQRSPEGSEAWNVFIGALLR